MKIKYCDSIIKGAVVFFMLLLLSACCSKGLSRGEKYADFRDMKIHYIDTGKGMPVIVLIHGWSCDISAWRFQIAELEKKYRVIALDLPGHGLSSKPVLKYDQPLFAESVKAVMDDAGVKKAVVMGHSMGFPVSRHFLERYPEMVSGLCIVDGYYQRVPEDPEKLAEWKKMNQDFLKLFTSEDRNKNIENFLSSLFVKETSPELKKEITSGMLSTPAHVADSALAETSRPEAWKDVRSDVPTLAVFARNKDLPTDNEKYLKSLYPRLEYHEWDNAGHFLMMEQPERFNSVFIKFIEKNAPDLKSGLN